MHFILFLKAENFTSFFAQLNFAFFANNFFFARNPSYTKKE